MALHKVKNPWEEVLCRPNIIPCRWVAVAGDLKLVLEEEEAIMRNSSTNSSMINLILREAVLQVVVVVV